MTDETKNLDSKSERELALLSTNAKRTFDELIAELQRVRAERKRIAELDKILIEEWRAAESILMSRLDEQKVNQVSTGAATASITEEEVPVVLDWDTFYDYIYENKAWHLLQRRVATAAWRELLQNGFPVPGLEPYTKREISLRKRS